MATWPLPTQLTGYSYQRGTTTAGLSAVNVPTGGTAHTKGAWTQVRASTGTNSTGSVLRYFMGGHTASATASPALVDIAYGTAGNEVLLIENLDVGFAASPLHLLIPCQIPAASRLVARAQGARTAENLATALDVEGGETLIGAGVPTVARWTTYGTDAANSRGTAVTPGNTNTFGSWVSLGTASSDHDFWFTRAGFGADTTVTSLTYRLQLAVCASTGEADAMHTNMTLNHDWVFSSNSAEYTQQQQTNGVEVMAAPSLSGHNVYVRAAASGTARTIYVSAYGGN